MDQVLGTEPKAIPMLENGGLVRLMAMASIFGSTVTDTREISSRV